jgi:hypothetical protein
MLKANLTEAFFKAVYRSDLPAVIAAYEGGQDLNEVDEATGMAAIHIATGLDDIEIARFLIEHRARFFPDARGRWPSIIGIECKVSDEMLDLVLEAEAPYDDPFGGGPAL